VAEALYEVARQQWRRLVSKFSAVTRYVAVALLAGLVATVVMMVIM
jgi:hypothetical protein